MAGDEGFEPNDKDLEVCWDNVLHDFIILAEKLEALGFRWYGCTIFAKDIKKIK